MRAKQRRFKDTRPQARHPDPDPRRRRVRRPGARRRDAEPLATRRATDRRHDPHRRQQPDRLHHRPARRPSTRYCTDVAKMIAGADLPRQRRGPRGVRLRRRAGPRLPPDSSSQDVVIDMVCYRSHGHNEGDEPAFTQPLMYGKITRPADDPRASTPSSWSMTGELSTPRRPRRSPRRSRTSCEEALRGGPRQRGRRAKPAHARASSGALEGAHAAVLVTPRSRPASPRETLRPDRRRDRRPSRTASTLQPEARADPRRRGATTCEAARPVDWGSAEALAFGSLLLEGTPVRLSGQDSRRGTFSQRHAVARRLRAPASAYVPLKNLDAEAGRRSSVYDSLLSEAAVLGFEFGYSLDEPEHAGHLGGAVRRLRQRRPGHHRPVHRLRRVEVGPRQRPGHAPAARLRGPGAGALQRPGSSGSCSCAPRTTSRSSTRRRRRSTSTCCAGR